MFKMAFRTQASESAYSTGHSQSDLRNVRIS